MLIAMARAPRPRLLAAVHTLEQRKAALVADLLREEEFVVGTVSEVHARCGKPGCQCTRGAGHFQTRLLYAEGGRRRCKLIRQADADRVRRAGARYRHLRAALRALAALHARELRLLRTQAARAACATGSPPGAATPAGLMLRRRGRGAG